ncbi:MAG: amidohydrolase [Pseudomonadales bacterium]
MKNSLLTMLCAGLLVACGGEPPPAEPADLVIRNARIWTADPGMPMAAALAIRGENIVAVGANDRVDDLIGPTTELIDAPPGLVLPGFIDSHVHMMSSGFELSSVQLRDARTPEEFARRIGNFAAGMAPGDWLLGGTWDHQNWGGELPHRDWIDALTPQTPVLVMRLDGHMALANSLALQLAGIEAESADVPGGEIVRNADGTPTGVLKDNAMNLVQDIVPAPSAAQEDQALEQAMAYLAERGVTTVHDMGYDWSSLAVYRRARENGALRTRIHANVPLASWEQLAAEVAEQGRGDDWLRIGGLKGFMDGSLGSHTAAFFEPFTDTPEDRGFFVTDPTDVERWAIAADQAGLQLIIHAIGDRANAALLDIYDRVAAANGARDRRARIEHAQHLRPAEIARIAAAGILPSMQPYHAIDDGRWAESVIGPERARYTYAFRSLLDAGVPVAFGSDWSVAPADPLAGIVAAVTRQTLDGAHPDGWVPEEKISVEQSLIAYTRNGAHAGFEEDRKGSLSTGKLADVVLLDRDILTVPVDRIGGARVERTIVGGRTVYRRD